VIKTVLASLLSAGVAAFAQTVPPLNLAAQQALVKQYCAGCHSDRVKSGGFSFTKLDLAHPEQNAAQAEKVIAKLQTGMMPPAGLPRPDAATIKAFAAGVENTVDAAVAGHINPGRPALHRLNRTEYSNSIKELLGVDYDATAILPADDMSHGFDNMSDVLMVSPTLMEAYVRAAGQVSRAAVGDPAATPGIATYKLPRVFSQVRHVEGTPMGTRGGIAVKHYFPADAEYSFQVSFYYSGLGAFFGQNLGKGQEIEISVDGERVAVMDLDPFMKLNTVLRTPRVVIKAGPHLIAAAFPMKASGPVDDDVAPIEQSLVDVSNANVPGLTSLPHLHDVGINGPYNVTGISDFASRKKIFVCRPSPGADEVACAKKVIAGLVRQAWRRPSTDADVESMLSYFQQGRNDGDFDSGIRTAIQAIVANPQFVFRFERTPANITPGSVYRISDLELASRLSFFLWSAPPDDQLITLASQDKLKDPVVLEQQVRRMVSDPRSAAMSRNFAGQWLRLQNLKDLQPDDYQFPDYDKNLFDSMKRETELFFDTLMREDHSAMDILTANYTYVDERLAKHYGIPNVTGPRFRKVTITDENRYGILGQGSILALTSVATRTSPVNRGKWVLNVLLGVPAPTPPPNVPPLKENAPDGKALSVRERMEAHRENEPCHSCHQIMDPLGFAFDNFDTLGQWRVKDSGFVIDPSGTLYDGTKVSGPKDVRNAILNHTDAFLRGFSSEMLMYGVGRVIEPTDMPAVRAIDREAAKHNYRISGIILGIVKSAPFQMRKAEEAVTPAATAAPAQ
jgi:hypothetical protein